MNSVITSMIETMVSGISTYATGFGAGIKALIEALFLETTTGTGGTVTYALSTVGWVTCAFAAISLAVGLSRFVLNWVTSLGAKN